ncbi:MAG: RNA polymerase sigma factor [Bacteroidota bacterium]
MTAAEYNKCVDDYADSIFRFIVKNLRNEDVARDVVQDTFEKLWIKVSTIEVATVKSYLFTTAYHTMIDAIRKAKPSAELEDAASVYAPHNQYSDLKGVLNRALNKLPEEQRSVVLLRDYEGYSYEEIGQITGLSESQVKVYIYRARVFLKSYLVDLDSVI